MIKSMFITFYLVHGVLIYVYFIGFEWLPFKVMTKNMTNLKPQFFYFLK